MTSIPSSVARGGQPGQPPQSSVTSLPVRGEPSEDLVQMDLGAARLRILAVLPVDERAAHYMRPMRRASASSTPLTNFALCRAAESLGEADRFLDHDARRRLADRELGGGQAQHAALDGAEALEAPVRRDVGELRVELAAAAARRRARSGRRRDARRA